MEKFKNKYRIKSNRMPHWDYAGNGRYFITLVTQNRACNLGMIEKENIILSDFGKIVQEEWLKSFEMRLELFCDEYIIMPNHLHAIVILNNQNNIDDSDGTNGTNGTHGTHVERHGRASLRAYQNNINPTFVRKPKSISSFVGGFKSSVNTKIDDYIDAYQLDMPKYNRNNHFFQPNFHDHIIRNDKEYERIKNYIINNPSKWRDDTFNPSNR